MNAFWWIIIGLFVGSSIYIFYWIYRFYKGLKDLIEVIRELYYTFKKSKRVVRKSLLNRSLKAVQIISVWFLVT